MKLCVTVAKLVALKVIGYVPIAVDVPLRTPVAELKVTPAGRLPDSLKVRVGEPVAITLNVPNTPELNVTVLLLVMGLFGHNLYRYNYVWYAAISSVLVRSYRAHPVENEAGAWSPGWAGAWA